MDEAMDGLEALVALQSMFEAQHAFATLPDNPTERLTHLAATYGELDWVGMEWAWEPGGVMFGEWGAARQANQLRSELHAAVDRLYERTLTATTG